MIDLFAPGIYLRCPGGNVERPDLHDLAADWAALNVGGDDCVQAAEAWLVQRTRYAAAGMPYFPWAHCRSIEDVERLIATGVRWSANGGAAVIGLNVEDVVSDGLDLREVADLIRLKWIAPHHGQVHMATLPWVQNGQGWKYLAFAVAALEIFPDEQTLIFPGGVYLPRVVEDCIEHAFAEGLTKVTLMFKTKGYEAADYGAEYAICHSLYTADDVPVSADAWSGWAPQRTPCVRPKEDPVPEEWWEKPYEKGAAVGPEKLPRILKPPSKNDGKPMIGDDALAFKRAISRAQRWKPWDPDGWDRGYGERFAMGRGTGEVGDTGVRGFQRQEGLTQTGVINDKTYQRIRRARVPVGPNEDMPLLDSVAIRLLRKAAAEYATVAMCYPHQKGAISTVCQGLHETAGLDANWACDFCAPAGTKVYAVEAAKIVRLSGTDPAQGADQDVGIFGWSIHYETPRGYRYFSTHYGYRTVTLGQVVEAGHVIGAVGEWPGNPGRSHTHLGVTSPYGEADAKARILAVSTAPRV